MPKTKRLDLRLEEDADELIRCAAESTGMSVSTFMVNSALEKAEVVLRDRAFSVVDPDAWDAFMARLEAPPVYKPELAKLFSEPDIFE